MKDGKLENVSLVVNGDDVEKRTRTYGYVHSYSAGYAYYGGYLDNSKASSKKGKKNE